MPTAALAALHYPAAVPETGRDSRSPSDVCHRHVRLIRLATAICTVPLSSSPPLHDEVLTVDALVHEHSPAMYRLALSIVRDHSLAEDVVQDAMMKAWQALDTFRGDSSPRTWLLRITHNTAISALRKRRDDITPPEHLPERPSPHASVEERAVLQADAHEIWTALRKLDQLSRTIVVLREVDQMSYDEIAEVLDLPVGTVRTRLFRARQQLSRRGGAA